MNPPALALGLEWLRPAWWPALLALPLVLAACLAVRARRRAALAAACDARFAERFAAEVDARSPARRAAFAALAALGLGLALLGPARGSTTRTVELRGLDIVVCLDTSRSMLARDLRPDRLGRARREIEGLLEVLREDRVALLAFSGDARQVAPLTRDRQALRGLLAAVDPLDNRVGGTDLGAAIERALELFDGRSGAHEAIVLLTDGEDLEGRGAAAAEEARARGIRIYVVGLGSAEGSKIPLPIDEGTEGFLRDRGGQEVVSALQDESLRRIAALTEGAYLSTSESPTPLEDLYRARLARLDGRASLGGVQRVPHDRYQLPLALAALALALELASSARVRRTSRTRGGARSAPQPLAPGALAGFALAFVPQAARPAVPATSSAPPQAAAPGAASSQPSADPALEAALMQLESRSRDMQADERERARAAGALGLALARAEDAPGAAAAFERARALAGPGTLRDDCGYNAATVLLQAAERSRAQFRELAEATDGGADPEELRNAHARALAECGTARTALLELLRAQPRDRDARANLELAARWLRELENEAPEEQQPPQPDPEQQQGEEGKPEQQPQDEQQQDQQQPQSQPAQQQPPESSQSEQQPEQQPPQDDPSAQGEQGDSQRPEDAQQQPEDAQPQEQPQSETPQPGEEPPAEQREPGEPESKPKDGSQAREQEVELTREELMRLLDQLEQLERQGAAVREALRRVGRRPVERDW